jgi:hypothetical protein
MNFKSYYFYSLSRMIFMNTLRLRFTKSIIKNFKNIFFIEFIYPAVINLKTIISLCRVYKENVLKKLMENS